MKKQYITPILEVYTYKVEKGYVASVHTDPILIGDVSDSLENIEEGNNYDLFGDDNWF